jgi:hypothetical protein
LHDGDTEKGEKSVRWEFTAPSGGSHELRFAYSAHSNRAKNVPVVVTVNGKVSEYVIDQSKPAPIDGLFYSLGKHTLKFGDKIEVTASNKGTQGYVVVDALQLLPTE